MTAAASPLVAGAAPEPHLLLQGSPQLALQLRLLFLGLRQGGVVLLGELVQGVLQLHQVAGDLPQLRREAGQAAVSLSSPRTETAGAIPNPGCSRGLVSHPASKAPNAGNVP